MVERDSVDALAEQIRTLEATLKKRTAELEAVTSELASFAYSVSHDLRAPLRAIDGFTEALVEDYGDKLDEQGVDYLRRVRGAAERMDLLIKSLVELARVSRDPLRRAPIDITELAQSIAIELQQNDPSRNVKFVIEPALRAHGDAGLLRTAFNHLLGNAWKFTSKHPAATIEVGSEKRDGHHVLYVRDDGAGFDPAYAEKMFGPFQRFHPEAEFEGLGIGLAMVQRIIHRHGGKVSATGEREAGATIYIELE